MKLVLNILRNLIKIEIEYHDLSEADSIKFFGVIPNTLLQIRCKYYRDIPNLLE